MAFPRPPFKLGPLHATVDETFMYYVVAGLFVVAVVGFWLIVRSPFGQTLVAIKQNELRVRYLGAEHRSSLYLRRDRRCRDVRGVWPARCTGCSCALRFRC